MVWRNKLIPEISNKFAEKCAEMHENKQHDFDSPLLSRMILPSPFHTAPPLVSRGMMQARCEGGVLLALKKEGAASIP